MGGSEVEAAFFGRKGAVLMPFTSKSVHIWGDATGERRRKGLGGSEAEGPFFGRIRAVRPDLCIKTSYGRGLCSSEGSE